MAKVTRFSSDNNISLFPADKNLTSSPQMPRASFNLPEPLSGIVDSCIKSLEASVRDMFGQVDDTFFGLAEKAQANTEQAMYFDTLRDIRVQRSGIEKSFVEGISKSFQQLTNRKLDERLAEDDSQQAPSLSLENLEIVKNDDLDISLAYSTMRSGAEERMRSNLSKLNTRLNSLLGVHWIDERNSPFGPGATCKSMFEAIKCLDVSVKARLMFLKVFEKSVLNGLDRICDDANHALIEAGVLPDYKGYTSGRTERKSKSPDEGNRGSEYIPGDGGNSNNQVDRLPPITGSEANLHYVQQIADGNETSPQLILNQLLHHFHPQINGQPNGGASLPPGGGHRNTVASDMPMASRSRPVMGSVVTWPIGQNMSGESDQANLNASDPDQKLINLVAMLFDFILNDRNLAEPMKVLISRLQIPMVRLGLNDSASLSKRSHPAWKLLNELAVAALNWDVNNDPDQDPLYAKISDIVERINAEYDEDSALFEELLNEFEAFLTLNGHKSQEIEQPIKDEEKDEEKEKEKARSDKAWLMVNKIIKGYTHGRELPEVTLDLLKNHWSKVLFQNYQENGPESESWDTAVLMVKKLVWSAEARDIAEKSVLMYQALPSIYQELSERLSSVTNAFEEATGILAKLDILYFDKELPLPRESTIEAVAGQAISKIMNQAMQAELEADSLIPQDEPGPGEQQDKAAPELSNSMAGATAPRPPATEAKHTEVVAKGKTEQPVVALAEPKEIGKEAFLKAESLEVGTWVRFSKANNQSILCKLALKLKIKEKHIFVDHCGMKVTEKTKTELAREIQCGRCEVFDDDEMFNTALNSVLSGLSRSAEKRSPTL